MDLLDRWGPKVPGDVKRAVASAAREIAAGRSPFIGPIYDNKGKLRTPKGATLSDLFLYDKGTWYVEGVTT